MARGAKLPPSDASDASSACDAGPGNDASRRPRNDAPPAMSVGNLAAGAALMLEFAQLSTFAFQVHN